MGKITDKYSVVCLVDDPIPIAFLNAFEEGDEWVKIQGCEACPVEQKIKCCGDCPCVTPKGECYWHIMKGKTSQKPFHCVVSPQINMCNTNCVIEYKCTEGKNTGKVRRVKDKLNVFVG